MFLKQERPERGDFERIKKLVVNPSILRKYWDKCTSS